MAYISQRLFRCSFLNEDIWISIDISLKFVSWEGVGWGGIGGGGAGGSVKPTIFQQLVQIMGDQAPSHYLNQWWYLYWRIYAWLNLNELTNVDISRNITGVKHYEHLTHLLTHSMWLINFLLNAYSTRSAIIRCVAFCFITWIMLLTHIFISLISGLVNLELK